TMTSNIFAVAFVMVSRETTQSLWPPGSLSNAEIGKDSIENVFVVYQPSDLFERLARIVEIHGDEFGGKTIAQRRRRMAERAFGALQRGPLTQIGDHHRRFDFHVQDKFAQCLF